MNYIKARDERFARLDTLVGELSFYMNAYAHGSQIENEDSSDVAKAEKLVEITQEMHGLELELETINELIGGK